MLTAYVVRDDRLLPTPIDVDKPLDPEVIWLDLMAPAADDDKVVERLVGIDIPTREEAEEIEPSNRLYFENGARYMTAAAVYGADEKENPLLTVLSYILTAKVLVTVRYEDLRSFKAFTGRVIRNCGDARSAEGVFIGLLEAQVQRNADVIEQVSAEIDTLSHNIFSNPTGNARKGRYQNGMRMLGRQGDLLSKTKESLLTLARVAQFYLTDREAAPSTVTARAELKNVISDVHSLADHTNFMISKVSFMLDAIVGLVSIEQGEIIKLFSVVAFVFLPPTLVASIYGMNFDHMPELHWKYGYPLALILMVISAIVPYQIFKWKKWF